VCVGFRLEPVGFIANLKLRSKRQTGCLTRVAAGDSLRREPAGPVSNSGKRKD
jgi:hypothetical protein